MEIEVGGAVLELPDGASDEAVRRAIENFRASPEFERMIDKQSGAPARVRAIVGGAPTPDRLPNIQRFFPDAVPFGEDNFVFTDPGTGRPTLYNPEGLDVGDVASVGREVSQTVGAGFGAAFGAAGGFVAGTPTGPGAFLTGTGGAAAGAGLGSAAGGTLFDVSMNLFQGRVDTRSVGRSLIDTALDTLSAAAGQKAGDLLGRGVKRVLGGGTEAAKRVVDRFRSLKIQPTAAAATGSRTLGTLEKGLEATPGSASIMQESAERVLAQTKSAADDVAARFGQVQTQQGAGSTIRQAAVKAAERFKFTQERAYAEAFDLVGADTPVVVNSVKALREQMEFEVVRAPRSLEKALKPALAQLRAIELDAADGIPFDALRQVRTMIGRDIDQVLVGSTGAQKEALKRIYGALTEDMSAAAQAAGPAAARKLAVADRFTRQFMNTAAQTLNKIGKFETDEQAFRFAMSASRDGGTALSRMRRSFTPEEWDTVAGTVLGRMGLARPGAQAAAGDTFSVNTFLTNWNRLAPEAKQALFGGRRYRDIANNLDNLVEAVGSLKGVEKLTNTSNTARNLIAFTTINTLGAALGGIVTGDVEGAGGGALVALTGSVVAPRVAARLITSPSFVRWLTTPITNPNGLSAHIGRLVAIAKAEPEIREEIEQFIQALRPAPADQSADR